MKSKRGFYIVLLLIILLIVITAVSLMVGRFMLSLSDIKEILLGSSEELKRNVFINLRLSRTIFVIISGFGFGVVGGVFQTIFKNPLASPNLVGVSAGANLGAAASIVLFSSSMIGIRTNAFIGAVLATLLALTISVYASRRGNNSGVVFILAGVAINSIAQGIIMFFKYFADPERELASIEYWSMGSFSTTTLSKLYWSLPMFLLGIVIIFLFRWRIQVLSLSDHEVKSLGINLNLNRVIIVLASSLIIASIVSVTGLIAFIGLVSPHIARLIYKRVNTTFLFMGGMVGSIILLLADVFARSVSSSEIPISIWTTLIGAPYLIYLVLKGKKYEM